MKHKVVIPSHHNYIIKTVTDITPYKNMHPVYIDPDLTAVQGLSPDKWTYKDGKFVPKSENEKKKSEEYHNIIKENKPVVSNKYLKLYAFFTTLVIIGILINKLI